jgi:hypothetical protein
LEEVGEEESLFHLLHQLFLIMIRTKTKRTMKILDLMMEMMMMKVTVMRMAKKIWMMMLMKIFRRMS